MNYFEGIANELTKNDDIIKNYKVYMKPDFTNSYDINNLIPVEIEKISETHETNKDGIIIVGKEIFNNNGTYDIAYYRGNAVYIINEDGSIQTSNGVRYIISDIINGIPRKLIATKEEIKGKYYPLAGFTSEDGHIFALKLYEDFLFNNANEAFDFLDYFKLKDAILTSEGIIVNLNGKDILYNSYYILVGKTLYKDDESKQKVFDEICRNCSAISGIMNYQKKFKLSLKTYYVKQIS